ncbi:uncharacterized protein LOC128329078 isoform X1 [Hemicordylus capensis]|uniref:uncharacterized protein LOC128329078 isoform X1 n=1 Tax=Hemicordylus capensis TaxID=884348 RepID=UPI00230443ED|nr:uncharacterized protein LOC128329078 isoform X1 [Hemicordylus capensis]
MERMEVEPSAGGGALRRSNSAPQLPGPAGTPPLEQLPGPQRSRRSSVCLDSGLAAVEAMETLPKDLTPASSRAPPVGLQSNSPYLGTIHGLPTCHSAGTPNSCWYLHRAPGSGSRRSPPRLETLKRKGGLDIDSPPKKLFVAGVPITPPAP